jgi:hypothetical protein
VIKVIGWIGTFCGILGSISLATKFYPAIGYASFLLGSMACLYIALINKDKANITLWGFFFCINILGVYNYAI